MPMSTAQILAQFASELGVSSDDHLDDKVHKIPNDQGAMQLVAWEEQGDDEDDECDFSSFPSLSLEETPGNYHAGVFRDRSDVESHVESLLARPILLGKPQAEDNKTASDGKGNPEDDSLDEFFANSVQEVPKLMLGNFCTSFNTLMNSRLRAYANFLARHALSHARCSKTDTEIEGVVSIERKLETMMGIGHQVSAASISSEFSVELDQYSESAEDTDTDEVTPQTTFQASMPLKMNISINIVLPHVEMEGSEGDETVNVTFETSGKIFGIFSRPSNNDSDSVLLRVAEVNLNMHKLLTDMTEQAARVISCIVDMTNKVYAIPLPRGYVHKGGNDANANVNAFHFKQASPMLKKRNREDDEDDEDGSDADLSPEKCANIVDCVIGEIDDGVLSPPHQKKVKVLPAGL